MTQPTVPGPGGAAPSTQEALQKHGLEMLPIVARCLKTAALYQLDNDAMRRMMADTVAALRPIIRLKGGALQLQIISDHAFLNQTPLRLRDSHMEILGTLRKIFERLGIHEISFAEDVGEADLFEFLAAYQRHVRSTDPGALCKEKFARIGLRRLEMGGRDKMAQVDPKQNLLRLYSQLVVDLRIVVEEIRRGASRPPLNKLRLDMQGLVDHCGGNESLLVGLTRSGLSRGEHAFHGASVAALSMLLVRRLGVDKKAQVEAGLAGVFHDLGRVELPEFSGVELPEGTEYAAAAQRVPLRTVMQIAAAGLHRDSLGRIVVAHEHALPLAPQGVPPPVPLARVVAVPCFFDLMTAPPPSRPALMPDEVLRLMMEKGGQRFDPRVLKLFVSTVGLYPAGTTVKLSGGQIAVVIEAPKDPAQAALPRVRVVRDAGGAADYIVDLAQPGEKLRVVCAVDPKEAVVNVTHFLFA